MGERILLSALSNAGLGQRVFLSLNRGCGRVPPWTKKIDDSREEEGIHSNSNFPSILTGWWKFQSGQ